jgi:hypothetical protein
MAVGCVATVVIILGGDEKVYVLKMEEIFSSNPFAP